MSNSAAGFGFMVSAPTFTIPSATQYAAGDLVANHGTAGSVVPLVFKIGRSGNLRAITITKMRLRKTGTGVSGASFRLHLYRRSPTPANGDNAAYLTDKAADYLGALDVSGMQTLAAGTNIFNDGAAGNGAPVVGQTITVRPLNDDGEIYGLLEARSTYTPTNGETVEVSLEGYAD